VSPKAEAASASAVKAGSTYRARKGKQKKKMMKTMKANTKCEQDWREAKLV